MYSYFNLCRMLGKHITPPGGTDLYLAFMLEHYFSNNNEQFSYLDVASNSGEVSRELATFNLHKRIVGIDIDSESVCWANKLVLDNNLNNIKYICCDAAEIPLMNSSFDYINLGVSFGFFVERRTEALSEVKRLLKPGGVVFANSLFYKRPPSKELIKKVEKVLGINIPDAEVMNYEYHNDYIKDNLMMKLDCEIKIDFDGKNTYQDYFNYISEFCDSNPNSIGDLDQRYRNELFHIYATQREVLNENDLHCGAVFQAWKIK